MPRWCAVPDRLSPLDVSFLYLEEPTTPMHVGGVSIFEAPEGGFDYDRLVELIGDRIAFVPRYRQRIRWVPGRLANPVWVDDENFDVTYHVRRSALPQPGHRRAAARARRPACMSRPLDRNRPLWEMYLVEGAVEGGRFAIITKTHHAMVDGVGAVDIGQVILDATPEPARHARGHLAARRRAVLGSSWSPAPSPTPCAGRPASLDTVRGGLADFRATAEPAGRRAPAGCSPRRATAARVGPGQPAQRGDRRAAALRDGRTRPRRPQARPQGARRHRQRRRARDRRRRAARLAADPRRDGQRVDHGAGDGAGQHPGRRAPGAAAATGWPPTSSTCRSASRARSCGCTR